MFPKVFPEAPPSGLKPLQGRHSVAPDVSPGYRWDKKGVPKGRHQFWLTLFSRRDRTFHPRTLAAVALAGALSFSAQAQKPAGATITADLPAGPMQAKATTACLECHEARIILQQRLSTAAWTKEVDKMTKWGAVVDPADRDALIDYLSTNFSPDKPAYEPPRTSAGKSDSANSPK
jgi:hypothetical protein